MEAYVQKFTESLAEYGPSLIGAILILVLGWWVARIVTGVIRRMMKRADVDDTLVSFLTNLGYVALMTLVVIAALGRLGVNTTSFAAVIAAAGLAVGFALQGSLSNFAAGVMLILFRPFKAGDFIEAGGTSGTVEEIQIFHTVLKTPDNRVVIVANSAVTGGNITNYSAKDTRRIDLVIGIGYGDDIAKAKAILERILSAEKRVLADPAPTVAVSNLGDSSVDLVVRPWVASGDYWPTRFDLTETIKTTFDAENIQIPFPQSDVHLHQVA